MKRERRYRVLLISRDGRFVPGHHGYSGPGLPAVLATIDVQATEQRTHTLRTRVTRVDPHHPVPIVATETRDR
jgi:hypothetical protein